MPGSQHKDLREDDRFLDLQATFEEAAELLFGKFLFHGLEPEAATKAVCYRVKKVLDCVPGPIFDDAGYITPMQVYTEAEVACWFGFTDHRERLLQRIDEWIRLARAVRARRLLLDGSFVTQKKVPGDVDAVVLLPNDFRDRLRASDPAAVKLHDMFRRREPKELFAAEDEEDWWQWFGFFSRTREASGRYKGLIEVAL